MTNVRLVSKTRMRPYKVLGLAEDLGTSSIWKAPGLRSGSRLVDVVPQVPRLPQDEGGGSSSGGLDLHALSP